MTPTAPIGPYVYQPHPVSRTDGRLWAIGNFPDGLTRAQAEAILRILTDRAENPSR